MSKKKKIDKQSFLQKTSENTKGFVNEFKKFITRGNVIDMATGVIVAGAFTKIVTSLTNDVIMPMINALMSLISGGKKIDLITILNGEPRFITDSEGVVTANPACIFINWSNFIECVLNFFIIAFIIFVLVKIINKVRDELDKAKQLAQAKLSKDKKDDKNEQQEGEN